MHATSTLEQAETILLKPTADFFFDVTTKIAIKIPLLGLPVTAGGGYMSP